MRADVWISWRPAPPAASYVSGTVSSVEVAYQPSSQGDTHVAASRVVTDRKQVARLTALVNGLPMMPPGGAWSCPAVIGRAAEAEMTFTADAGVWTFTSATCPSAIDVVRDGSDTTGLQGGDFTATVQSTLADSS